MMLKGLVNDYCLLVLFFTVIKKNVQIIYLRAQLIGDKMWTLKQIDEI
mgnify:FL=1